MHLKLTIFLYIDEQVAVSFIYLLLYVKQLLSVLNWVLYLFLKYDYFSSSVYFRYGELQWGYWVPTGSALEATVHYVPCEAQSVDPLPR